MLAAPRWWRELPTDGPPMVPRPLWIAACCVWELVLAAGEAAYLLATLALMWARRRFDA